MARARRLALIAASAVLAMGSLAAAGCGDDDDSGAATSGGDASLSGTIPIDGSSTVGPLTSAAVEGFTADAGGGDVNITVGTSGTGGGFELFCKGETDISNASRPIDEDEVAACQSGGVQYEELRVASDGITLVTGADTDVGSEDITKAQLKAIWGPDSKIGNWKDVPPAGSFSDVPLTLAGPDSQSGTYDFFNEEILGEDAAGEVIEPRQDYSASADDNVTVRAIQSAEGGLGYFGFTYYEEILGEDAAGEVIEPRQDYSASADDNVTVRAIQSAEGGLGYFGFTYYEENMDTLKAFSLDGVAPSAETITDGTYPLSRPLFIYVNKEALTRPEVKAFVQYYLENATTLAEEQQFVPAPQEALDEGLAKLG